MSFKPVINSNDKELFSYQEVPEETNPFCNDTENSFYSRSYSQVIPAFFFREVPLSIKPTKAEKYRLKYFYNVSGMVMLLFFLISTAIYLFINIGLFAAAMLSDIPDYSWTASLQDPVIRSGSLTVSTLSSAILVFLLGCRYSGLSPSSVFENRNNTNTIKIFTLICFVMCGLFFSGVYSFSCIIAGRYIPELSDDVMYFTSDIRQLVSSFIYYCIAVPVCNALIFRGILLTNLSRVSQKFGIFAASFLCAVSSSSAVRFIPAFLMSLLLCYITVRYGSILCSLIIHILVCTANMAIKVYSDLLYSSNDIVIRLWAVITGLTGILFVFFVLIKERMPKTNTAQKKRTLSLFMTSSAVLASVIVYICSFMLHFIRMS